MDISAAQGDAVFKTIVMMAAAAIVAGFTVMPIAAAPKANIPGNTATRPQDSAKSNRLAVAGTACSQRGWPEFERSCQFDLRQPSNQARTVRVLALR